MPSVVLLQPAATTRQTSNGKSVVSIPKNPRCRASQTTPRWDLLNDLDEPLAFDIEGQTCKRAEWDKWHNRIGRISIVNTRGEVVYDTYVNYPEEDGLAVRMPPRRFNVTWRDVKISNGATPIWKVERNLHDIMYKRRMIGHGIDNDVKAIGSKVLKATGEVLDTQHIYGQKTLDSLVSTYLDISFKWHDPTDDAKAAMLLYLRKHPYKGRKDFQEEAMEFELRGEDFPALGAVPEKARS